MLGPELDSRLIQLLTQNARLSNSELSRRLGVSRVPVREALFTLEREGLVEFSATGRAFVKELTPRDFEELLLLRLTLEPLGARRLVAGSIDFIPGPGPRTLDLGAWGKAGVQVCYEIIFSGQVVDPRHRPDYIFNDSNDGWFGEFGPPQHLAQARLRAIEEGLPILRATTTGISAVIDARGVVRQHLPLRRAGRIDGTIPPAARTTPFARLGNILPLGWAVVILLLACVAMRRRAR